MRLMCLLENKFASLKKRNKRERVLPADIYKLGKNLEVAGGFVHAIFLLTVIVESTMAAVWKRL